MKTILKIVICIVVAIILVIAGIKGYTQYWASRYETTAVPYMKKVIPELSRWDPEIIKGHMPEDSLKNTSDDKILKIVDYLSKLGSLKQIGPPVFEKRFSGDVGQGVEQTIITYKIDATYENGDAVITMGLLVLEDSYKVNNFNINSPALLQ